MGRHRGRPSKSRLSLTAVFRLPDMMYHFKPVAFLLALAFASGTAAFAQKRAITEKDIFDFVWIGDPQVSPDGSRVAFVRVTVNDKKEGYNTSIWSVPVAGGEAPHQLTKGDHDSAPRWSPDGRVLLFLRATEKNG